jgi:hypothetical protein
MALRLAAMRDSEVCEDCCYGYGAESLRCESIFDDVPVPSVLLSEPLNNQGGGY